MRACPCHGAGPLTRRAATVGPDGYNRLNRGGDRSHTLTNIEAPDNSGDIAPEARGKVARPSGGAALGLAIVKAVARAHGVWVRLQNVKCEATTAEVRLR